MWLKRLRAAEKSCPGQRYLLSTERSDSTDENLSPALLMHSGRHIARVRRDWSWLVGHWSLILANDGPVTRYKQCSLWSDFSRHSSCRHHEKTRVTRSIDIFSISLCWDCIWSHLLKIFVSGTVSTQTLVGVALFSELAFAYYQIFSAKEVELMTFSKC